MVYAPLHDLNVKNIIHSDLLNLKKKKSHCTNIDFFCGNVLWKYSLIKRKFKRILFQTEIFCNMSHLLLMYPYWSKVLITVSTKIYSTIDNTFNLFY